MNTRYSDTHEWVRQDAAGIATVGISTHAQSLLGKIVHVELPLVGTHVKPGDAVGVIESVKAASDYYAPVGGEIVAVNGALGDNPQLINDAPEEAGWLYQIKLHDTCEFDALMSAGDYHQLIQG